jgi:hypothetical protein
MQPSLSSICRMTLEIYWESTKTAALALIKNWVILPGTILALLALKIATGLVSAMPLGIIGGFILGLVQLYLLTLYISWISRSLEGSKIRWRDLVWFDSSLFFRLLHVGFIFFLVHFVLGSLFRGIGNPFPILAVGILMAILLNPVTEVIYRNGFDGAHALSHSVQFVKDNFLEWFIPYFLFITPSILVGGSFYSTVLLIAQTDPLLPVIQAISPWAIISNFAPQNQADKSLPVILIVLVTLASFFMLFRGALFKELDSGSRRARAFKARM